MKIVVMSDSHRDFNAMYELVKMQLDSTNAFIFLGDGEREYEDIQSLYPNAEYYGVRGNCDIGSMSKATDVIRLGGVKIMLTHGNDYNVKHGLEQLKTAAKAAGCRIVLFGHTHTPITDYDNGLYIMNPGSLYRSTGGEKSYGVLEIKNGQILINTSEL